MFKKESVNYLQIICISIICCILLMGKSYAQTPTAKTTTDFFDGSKQYRIEASMFGGFGFEKHDLFETTDGDIVRLSPGGGFGGKLSLGYCLTPLFNVNLEIGAQNSPLSEEVGNANGKFTRTFLLGTLRYLIPLNKKSSINIGGGVGYYLSGKLDGDASQLQGGGHNIYEYKNTVGIHVLGEYERYISGFSFLEARWSWCIGLKYYNISYTLDALSSNGVSIPIIQLPSAITNEFGELDGSGIDMLFSIVMYH